MTSGPPIGASYRFGIFVANLHTGELLRKGAPVKLQDQPFQLLALLLEHPSEIVSRESVRERLWPANTFVEFDASLSVAVRKLRDALDDDADNPRFVETVPRKGYRFIAPVERLDVEPTNLTSPSESLSSRIPPTTVVASAREASADVAPPVPISNQLGWVALIGAVALAALLGFVFRWYRKPAASPASVALNASTAVATSVQAPFRRSVAVLGFRNLPGRPEEAWLSQAFTEMLNTELAAGGNLRMVSDEDVASAKREILPGNQDSLARATLARVREKSGADVVLLGSYTPMAGPTGQRIRLDVRLQDTFNGETIAEEAIVGKEQDLFELASRAGADLRKSLGIDSISVNDANSIRASLPSNETAVRYYSQGMAKLWAFDFVGAREELTKAIQADPTFPLAHSALADALGHLGYSGKASEEAQRAMELSQHLTEEDQLLARGQYQRAISRWPEAVETYRKLFVLRPDSLDYGLRLAAMQLHGKSSDALETVKTLRGFPPPRNDDPRIDLMEASAQIDSDLAKARDAAKRAVTKGTAQGSPLMVARAYGILCQQGSSVGPSTEDFANDCEQARKGYAAAGDYNNEARTLNDAAVLHFQRGELGESETMWRAAAKEFHAVRDLEGVAASSNNLGVTLFREGKLKEGRKLLNESVPSYQAVGDKDGLALVYVDLGDVSREEGNLSDAEAQYQRAKVLADEIGDKSASATVLFGVASIEQDKGALDAAQTTYGQSLSTRKEIGEMQSAEQSQLALARIALEQQRFAEAKTDARKSQEYFQQEHLADDQLAASIVQIHALLAQGQHQAASEEAERARALAAKSEDRLVGLEFSAAAALAATAGGHTDEARKQLQQAFREAHDRGLVRIELEIRLAMAEVEKQSGNGARVKAQLDSVQKDAQKRNFGLIAQEAARAAAH
jgi:eukaryotic-like serine/threonine-protein kinase